ncbi:MAG: hypothetical protein NWF06_03815 [Candidatus Bathyarchaeota archaeon]|nr:hypothetical protein [Candidatus Bathyarchaeum sp.]
MSRKKGRLVQKIILSDLESFGELRGKLSNADQKRVYNRAYKRLYDQKLTKEQIQSGLVESVRSELFKMLPKPETKIVTDAEKEEREEFEKIKDYPVRMRGFDIWGDSEDRKDKALKDLEGTFNTHVNEYMRMNICPICKSSVCRCNRNELE